MAIVGRFEPKNMTVDKYEETTRRLEAAGMGTPPGRLYHVVYGPPDSLCVIDVYESQEEMDKFAEVLGPILQEMGVELQGGAPDIQPVRNIVRG